MTNAAIQKRLTELEVEVKSLRAAKDARARLRAEILKGLESGPATKIDATFWKKMHTLARQHARRA